MLMQLFEPCMPWPSCQSCTYSHSELIHTASPSPPVNHQRLLYHTARGRSPRTRGHSIIQLEADRQHDGETHAHTDRATRFQFRSDQLIARRKTISESRSLTSFMLWSRSTSSISVMFTLRLSNPGWRSLFRPPMPDSQSSPVDMVPRRVVPGSVREVAFKRRRHGMRLICESLRGWINTPLAFVQFCSFVQVLTFASLRSAAGRATLRLRLWRVPTPYL